jgi:soluble lytic murein transglycosylase
VLHRSGDAAGAVSAWTALGTTDARVLYWLGVAQESLGDAAGSRTSFEAAVAAGPRDFHGLEAALELSGAERPAPTYMQYDLETAPDWVVLQAWVSAMASPGQTAAAFDGDSARLLARLGMRAEAEQAIYALVERDATPTRLLDSARLAYEIGLKSTAARLAERLRLALGVRWSEAPVDLLRLGFPVDFPALLDREAKANGIDPLFMAALIRTESFWEPSAVSPVGALGLTQVMPATGEGIAAALDVEGFSVDALLRPPTSLRFGAFYVAEQIASFGHPFAALAAYNGGPGRAARWLESWDGRSAASFAETVDIEETRNYVELVLEAYARYQAAYTVTAQR